MPRRARKRCPTPGCGNPTSGGKCEPCKAKVEGRRGSSNDRGYGVDWQNEISKPFLKANPNCAKCGKRAVLVDHKKPRINGGTDAWSNLQSLCRSCHSRKTAKENALGGAR